MAAKAGGRPLVLLLAPPGAALDELRQAVHPHGIEAGHPAAAEGRRPDVVVAELLLLPVTDPDLQGLPVLAVVDRDAPEESARALAAGAIDVLPRPFDDLEVGARVAVATSLSQGAALLDARNAELVAWADRADHDMKTTLAVISGMAETLDAAWDRLAVGQRARMLASIRTQAVKAMSMVDEAVALARGTPPDEAPTSTADGVA